MPPTEPDSLPVLKLVCLWWHQCSWDHCTSSWQCLMLIAIPKTGMPRLVHKRKLSLRLTSPFQFIIGWWIAFTIVLSTSPQWWLFHLLEASCTHAWRNLTWPFLKLCFKHVWWVFSFLFLHTSHSFSFSDGSVWCSGHCVDYSWRQSLRCFTWKISWRRRINLPELLCSISPRNTFFILRYIATC